MAPKQGRKLLLDQPHADYPTRLDALVAALRSGNYLNTASTYAGVGYETVRANLRDAENAEARLGEFDGDAEAAKLTPNDLRKIGFSAAIKEARATSEVHAVGLIRKAAEDGSWQAAAWYLERSMPAKWGRWERVSDEVAKSGLTADQAREYLKALPDSPLARFVDQ